MIIVRGFRVHCDGYHAQAWDYDENDLPPDECKLYYNSVRRTSDQAWQDAVEEGWDKHQGRWHLCPTCIQVVRHG